MKTKLLDYFDKGHARYLKENLMRNVIRASIPHLGGSRVSGRKLILPLALLLGACATVPHGPTYGMYPPGSKERYCAEIAYNESPTGHGGQEAATGAGIGAVTGAALGAIAGALAGDPGLGAAAGAGLGLAAGGANGYDSSKSADTQRRYTFMECMSARWHKDD